METIRRTEAVSLLSEKLNLPEKVIRKTLQEYTSYIKEHLDKGVSIGILRMCFIQIKGYDGPIDTFAYICTEVSKRVEIAPEVVRGVLLFYENLIISDLKKSYVHNLYGLITIKMSRNTNGVLTPKITHSILSDYMYRVQITRSFKRKVCG